ncbi:hypothetical protein SUGI_0530690 [Cryptomeria japonica]|nr:hypothetical protein SUGI_0530690 [Cryptomeria japonica]
MLIDKIKGATEEVINGKILKGGPKKFNNWDCEIEKHWSLRRVDNLGPPKKLVDRKAVGWKAPPKEWAKLNFDGASRGGNRGEFGIGVIIKDDHGKIISGLYEGIGSATNNEAEIWALEARL